MDDKQFKDIINTVMSTIDEWYAGYRIQDMKHDIIERLDKIFFQQNPDAKKYFVSGVIDGRRLPYTINNCKAVAEVKLAEANSMTSNYIWEVGKFQVEEVGQQAGGYEKG